MFGRFIVIIARIFPKPLHIPHGGFWGIGLQAEDREDGNRPDRINT